MSVTVTQVVSERSLRAELGEFVQGVLERENTISVEKLVRMAHKHFNGDEWVREALIREGLNALIPEVAGDVRHRLRTRARAMDTADTRRDRIASVFESVGGGYSKSFFAMCRSDAVFARQQRVQAIVGHQRWVGLYDEVIPLFPDDTTTIGELPPEKINSLWAKHIEKD